MIFGSGELVLIASTAVDDATAFPDFYFPPCHSNFTMASETELSQISYLSLSGVKQNKTNRIAGEKYFVDLEIESTDYMAVQLVLGELSSIITEDIYLDEYVTVCPLTSTSFNDARINAEQENNTAAYNLTEKRIMLPVSDTADISPNRYFVNGAGNLIVFDEAQIGQALSIKIPTLNQGANCLGGFEGRAELLNYSFQGRFTTTAGDGDYIIQIPNLRRVSAPTFDFQGDKVTINVRYQAVSGSQEDTDRKPFRIYSPTSGIPSLQLNILTEDLLNILTEDDQEIFTEASV